MKALKIFLSSLYHFRKRVNTLILVKNDEKIVKIAWKMAKFLKKFKIWPLEGLAIKNNAKNELSAQKYPSLDTNINGVEMKEKMSRTCKTSSTSPWWRPPPWVLL